MSNTWNIFRKEWKHYLISINAYVVIVAFLLITGWFFSHDLFLNKQATLRSFFGVVPLLMIIFIPAISMRVFAEEKKQGTLELLLTMPLKDWEIVLGKFLASAAFLALLLGLTFIHPITLLFLGTVDMGPMIGGYLGLFFTGLALLSIGIFASSVTQSQVIAYIVSLFIGFVLYLLGQVVPFLPETFQSLAYTLGFSSHFESIAKGILDSRDLLYYGSLVGFFLFLTTISLEARKK
jgi:ABC-2 type transport system permease protein